MNFATERPFADPDKAARKLLELANAVEADRDQRIAIELINLPFLRAGGSADEYRAGIDLAMAKGWLVRHGSGIFVKFTPGRRGPVCVRGATRCATSIRSRPTKPPSSRSSG